MNVFQVHWHNAFVHNSKESSVPMFAQCFLPRSDRDARKVLDQPRDQPGDCVDNSWSAGQDYYLWSSFRSRTARCWSRSTVRASTSSTPLMWWVMWSFDHMDGNFKQWSYSWWLHLIISLMTLTPHWHPPTQVVLLGLKFEELSWDYAKPSQENNEDCLPCLFIQFCVIENGRRVSKILQVWSRTIVVKPTLVEQQFSGIFSASRTDGRSDLCLCRWNQTGLRE